MAVTKTPYVSTRKRVKAAAEEKAVAPKKRGRPAGSKNKVQKPVDWESLAKKLQRALAKEMQKNDELEWSIRIYRETIDEQEAVIEQLENRPWLSRIFNLKG